MRTVTSFMTKKTSEEVYSIFNTLLVNNKYRTVEGELLWKKGDGALAVMVCFEYTLVDSKITISSWLGDSLLGEKGIEKGFVGALPKSQARGVLKALIVALHDQESTIEGFVPIKSGKVNTNSEIAERTAKAFSASKAWLITSILALSLAIFGWILMFITELIYFMIPIGAILTGVGVLTALSKEKQENREYGVLIITLCVITFVVAGVLLLLVL